MSVPTVPVLAAGAALAAALSVAAPADAAPSTSAVFVADDGLSGNTVHAYVRSPDGALTAAGSYATGGHGGQLTGSVVDHTASQGALAADRAHRELLAVNAGSDSLSVFEVRGDRLRLRQILPTNGEFPVSATAHGDTVYVLNARAGGSLSGFTHRGNHLVPVPGWHRTLGLPVGAPEFTHTPGQVAFTPDGRHLVVTTKAATNSILVYDVHRDGEISDTPTIRSEPGAVPFAVAFDRNGHLAVAMTGTNSVTTYAVTDEGMLRPLANAPTQQAATCWIAASGRLLAASNAGSASVTTFTTDAAGELTKLADTETGPGTVDAAFTPDGRFLYVQAGARGEVDAYAVTPDGSLGQVGSTTVPGAEGGEGIVAW